MHGIKTSHSGRRYRGFRSTSHYYVTITQSNVVQCANTCIGSRSTSRNRCVIRSHKTMFNGNMTWGNISNHFRNKERIEPGGSVSLSEFKHLVLESLQTSDTCTPNDTNTKLINTFKINACIFYGFIRSHNSILCKFIQFPGFFPVKEIFDFKVFDLASEFSLKLFGIEISDRGRSTLSINQSVPIFFNIVTDRGESSQSRYYNSL